METDQIQKALFIKSDAQTMSVVAAALAPAHKWLASAPVHTVPLRIKIKVTAGDILDREGRNVRTRPVPTNREEDITAQDLRNALGYAVLSVSLHEVLKQMAEDMFQHMLPVDRKRYVDKFVTDVEALREEMNDLQDTVARQAS